MKSYLDLVNDCDKFPYFQNNASQYQAETAELYKFRIEGVPSNLGYVLPSTVQAIQWPDHWTLDNESKTITLAAGSSMDDRSKAFESTMLAEREKGTFKLLKGWGNERYPIYGPDGSVVLSVERATSALFGIVTYGVHLTAYRNTPDGLKVWVSRRSRSKLTYGGMLDSCVGGSITTGEFPFECLVREAEEEASFPSQLVQSKAKSTGAVTYFYIRDERAGGEVGMMQPECQYVYEIDVGDDFEPRPNDNEVEEFKLMTIDELRASLANAEFKPNSALILLDFFIRHGVLTPENETDYLEILARVHRKLEFPLAKYSP